jgi:hypothetical protein
MVITKTTKEENGYVTTHETFLCKDKIGRLRERYGGDWTYDRKLSCWQCADGREVRRCIGLEEGSLPEYWMYQDGYDPVSVDFTSWRITWNAE